MEIWFLGFAIAVLSIAIIYATFLESKRLDAIEALVRQHDGDLKHKTKWLQERHEAHTKQISDLLGISGSIQKEFEVMSIRQRTLEKKIIEANRTVNLVFGKPIPMQLENIPHTAVTQQRKGRGKGALINI